MQVKFLGNFGKSIFINIFGSSVAKFIASKFHKTESVKNKVFGVFPCFAFILKWFCVKSVFKRFVRKVSV